MRQRLIPDVVRDQTLATLPGSASVREAACLMRERRIGAVLVVTAEGRLAGIFTERDLVCRVVADGHDTGKTSLDEVMTRNPDTMGPSESAIAALRLMHDGGYRHLPIVEGGQLIGIVSRRDFDGWEKARLDVEKGLFETLR